MKRFLFILVVFSIINSVSADNDRSFGAGAFSGGTPAFIEAHRAEILSSDELLIKAMILLRLERHYELAAELAQEASGERPLSRRAIYERALVYFAAGDCASALLYFAEVAASEDDWMSKDSRRFMALCGAPRSWNWRAEFGFGHDNNLGNTNHQRLVRPEDGSSIAVLIRQLEANSAGLRVDDRFFLGRPRQSGWAVDQSVMLDATRRFDTTTVTAGISGHYRFTNPSGYARRGFRLELDVLRPVGGLLTDMQARFGRQTLGQGEHMESLIQETSGIGQGIYFPLTKTYTGGILLGVDQVSYPRLTRRGHTDQGLTLLVSSSSNGHKPDALPLYPDQWKISAYRIDRRAQPDYNDARITGLEATMVFKQKATRGDITLRAGIERERLIRPRPWRRSAHDIIHGSAGLTYDLTHHIKHPLILMLEWNQSRSNDPVDRQNSWNLSVRYLWFSQNG